MEKFSFVSKADNLPTACGVYAFKKGNSFLYIGKAGNLKTRVKSHFNRPSYRDNLFIGKVKKIGYIETDSEIEALILEAELIKRHQPKYNVLWKDDKNYFYIKIDKQNLPYIKITHQPVPRKKTEYIGPFIEGKPLKRALKTLRKVFPYYTTKNHSSRLCPFCHLNLCPGPDPDIKEYKKNIKNLKKFLEGKKTSVIKNLKKEMAKASKDQRYERAAEIRDKIDSLERIIAQTKIIRPKKETDWKVIKKGLKEVTGKDIEKIEAYDISNIQGQKATGSQVVFIKGKPKKDLYRKYKIKISGKPNDIAMIKELIKRRFKHKEWPYPDMILIDGGKAQLNAGIEMTRDNPSIFVASLAKRENKLFLKNKKDPLLLKELPQEISNLILYLRDESHRFAIKYHRKLRERLT